MEEEAAVSTLFCFTVARAGEAAALEGEDTFAFFSDRDCDSEPKVPASALGRFATAAAAAARGDGRVTRDDLRHDGSFMGRTTAWAGVTQLAAVPQDECARGPESGMQSTSSCEPRARGRPPRAAPRPQPTTVTRSLLTITIHCISTLPPPPHLYASSSLVNSSAKIHSSPAPKSPIGHRMTPCVYALSSSAPTTSLFESASNARPRSRW